MVVFILIYKSHPYEWAAVVLTKRTEKKLDGNYTRRLRAILNKSWRQHSSKHQQYGHIPIITKTIKIRRTRHAGHCRRCRDELISDILLWTPSYGRAKAGRPGRTYIQQLCADKGCSLEDLLGAMDDWEGGGRGSGRSMLAARHDDDNDVFLFAYVFVSMTNFELGIESSLLYIYIIIIFLANLLSFVTRKKISINSVLGKEYS